MKPSHLLSLETLNEFHEFRVSYARRKSQHEPCTNSTEKASVKIKRALPFYFIYQRT